MTSSNISPDTSHELNSLAHSCPKCGRDRVLRPEHPYPLILQVIFGASFILFLIFYQKLANSRMFLVIWTAAQFVLGALLIRGRLRARQRIYRCVICDSALR